MTLPTTLDYTARDFDSIKISLENYVRATEPTLWTDFFESNLGVLLIDFNAYVGDIVSFVADRISEEVFPVTAKRRNSLIKYARGVAYSPQGSSPSTVRVVANNDSIPSTFSTQGLLFYAGTVFTVDEVTFELIKDYYFPALTNPVEMDFTSGLSDAETFIADGRQWQEYTVEVDDVINDSWKVFVDGIEWDFVDNLLFYEAERVYEVVYEDDGSITVRFGNGVHGLIPASGLSVEIRYRYGGGISGNIESRSVNTTITGYFDDGSSASISINNPNRASGGEDPETIEHIKQWLPGWIKSNNRAVSVEDYMTLVNKFTDPDYGSPYRANARLRISGFGNIIGGIYLESALMPYVESSSFEIFAVGDGSTTNFTYNTLQKPIVPYTVRITGYLTFGFPPTTVAFEVRDDGRGGLESDYIIGGSVDYDNGIIQVSFRTGNAPVASAGISLYYEFSPVSITGVNRYDYSHLLGIGDGIVTAFSDTIIIPTSLLVPNEDAYLFSSINDFGIRLKTVLDNAGTDIPIDLFDGSLTVPVTQPVGTFTDLTGAPDPNVISSTINYESGFISITFAHPVKLDEGIKIYFTAFNFNWDEGDGISVAFSGYVGEDIVPGTLRVHLVVGTTDIFIRDNLVAGVWSLIVINAATGVSVVTSDIDYDAGYLSFTLSHPPDNLTLVSLAYRTAAEVTDLPYGVMNFVTAIDSTTGGLDNAGVYQWLSDRWNLLVKQGEFDYALPANVVDLWLWSQDTDGYLAFASEGLIDAVRDWLLDYEISTVQLNVESGLLQPFNIDIGTVYYDKQYEVNDIRIDIQEAIRQLLTSDAVYPGEEITVSELYSAIYDVEGVLGFKMLSPTSNISLSKNEMASFGKVERYDTGVKGLPSEQTIGYGDPSIPTLVFSSTLSGVGASNNVIETANSVIVETYVVTPTGIEFSQAKSIVGAVPGVMEFVNTVGNYVDTLAANSYVNVSTGAIQVTYNGGNPPDTDVAVVVTYWTEHFVVISQLMYYPVTGGTVRLEFGDLLIVDDGAGNLVSNQVSGSIDYDTGALKFDFNNDTLSIPPPIDGESLLATYNYTYKANFVPLVKGSVTDKMGYCPDWDCPD